MKDIQSRVEVLSVRLDEVEEEIEDLRKHLNERPDDNSVKVLTDDILREKEYVTEAEAQALVDNMEEKIEKRIKANHISLLKWVIGTGLSAILAAASAAGLFL